jgi:hypothetical protein
VVVAPRATDLAGLLEDGEVVEPGLLETDSHADAREPGPYDDDVVAPHGQAA